MNPAEWLKRAVDLGLGALTLTREKAEALINDLVKQGQVAPNESKEMLQKIIQRGEQEREALSELIQEQLKNWSERFDLAKRQELEELRMRVEELEQRLKDSSPPSPSDGQ